MVQIYNLIIDPVPFRGYGFEGVIGDMIKFIEDLPAEWRPKWEELKRTTTNRADYVLGKSTISIRPQH